jgi:Rhodopirellula transposase DDE domain
MGLSITVTHHPSGASKWNPIEHRLFSQISRNWRAEPLDSYEKTLKFIRTTTTTTGLKVTARLDTTYYPTGTRVSKNDLAQLSIRTKRVLPKWNYKISPLT